MENEVNSKTVKGIVSRVKGEQPGTCYSCNKGMRFWRPWMKRVCRYEYEVYGMKNEMIVLACIGCARMYHGKIQKNGDKWTDLEIEYNLEKNMKEESYWFKN